MNASTQRPASKGAADNRPLLELHGTARPMIVTAWRHRVVEFAAEHGAGQRLREDIAIAVSEAVTNVVRHAYDRNEMGRLILRAQIADRILEIQVSDEGRGFRDGTEGGLGLGLPIIAQLSADLVITQAPDGTTLRMVFAMPAAS